MIDECPKCGAAYVHEVQPAEKDEYGIGPPTLSGRKGIFVAKCPSCGETELSILRRQLDGLRSRLPKTKDGKYVVPVADLVYHPDYEEPGGIDSADWDPPCGDDGWTVLVAGEDGKAWDLVLVADCYSTYELAHPEKETT